ncbi:MrcB family domain-containing protein [Caulobacter segnis]|uniref:MrcB family domain-containing protein n=1 Tax=Caulobacter segnis TaxID=88688 RepID=UPI002855B060|nr:DUF3578 domain-containing protein [Caulobacter segnis]MDR6624370.1 5-methylcytosine-specific restriction protein A [Caulobacter segnis]
MVREAFAQFVQEYPRRPVRNDGTFAGNSLRVLVETQLVDSVKAALGDRAKRYLVRGSVGKGDWTHTPWLVVLDPAVTTSPERNYYVVYLLSLGCERLYLSLAQGCTTLKDAVSVPKAKVELARRAAVMRARAHTLATRLAPLEMDLGVDRTVWRGKLYEAGSVLGQVYDTRKLPSDADMIADLVEALDIYAHLKREGGWAAEDTIVEEAEADEIPNKGLLQSKTYRQHRTIERDRGHSREVKRQQGTRCRGCGFEMSEIYGEDAVGLCDAHHLVPLSSLEKGVTVTFDPVRDFAVLCPSCHRAIHRMSDSSDLEALRMAVRSGVLAPLLDR